MCTTNGPEWHKGWGIALSVSALGFISLVQRSRSSPSAECDAANGSHLQHFLEACP